MKLFVYIEAVYILFICISPGAICFCTSLILLHGGCEYMFVCFALVHRLGVGTF